MSGLGEVGGASVRLDPRVGDPDWCGGSREVGANFSRTLYDLLLIISKRLVGDHSLIVPGKIKDRSTIGKSPDSSRFFVQHQMGECCSYRSNPAQYCDFRAKIIVRNTNMDYYC